MITYIQILVNKIRSWRQAEANKPPLSSESAYAISAIGKQVTITDVYKEFMTDSLKKIKSAARYSDTELLIYYPEWLNKALKELFIKDIEKLNYTILFHNEDMVLISWKLK